MNNVKTRFVIAISQKLSAAPDSDAKVDMIEELSENLCGRYADMVNTGMPENEAFSTALDKLGDVNELLTYLDCCEKKGARAASQDQEVQPDDWFSNLGGLIQKTVDQAVSAANDAAAMVRDVAKSFDGGIVINMNDKRAFPRFGARFAGKEDVKVAWKRHRPA